MALELKHRHHEDTRSAVVQFVGACAYMEHVAANDLLGVLDAAGVERLVLDLKALGGINAGLTDCLSVWRRRFLDRGAEVIFVGPNVVVRWVLEKRLGVDLPTAASVEEALVDGCTALPESVAERPAWNTPARFRVLEGSRPDPEIFADVMQCLRIDEDPATWCGRLSSALARAGLASDLDLCVVRERRIEVVGHDDLRLRADGGLRSYLEGVDRPLAGDEIGLEGLADDERGFLSWCRADVLVPVVDDGSLIGLLAVRSGRSEGMGGYRSGEVLALALLGRLLAAPLAGLTAAPDDETVESEPAAAVAPLV